MIQKPESGLSLIQEIQGDNSIVLPLAITILCFYYYPQAGGGADRLMQRVAEVLAGRGWRMTVLTQSVKGVPRHETLNGVNVRRVWTLSLPGTRFFSYMVSAFWRQVVQRDASQVVHLNQLYLHVPLAIWLRRLRGPRVVLRIACGGLYSDILRAQRLPLGLGRWVLGAARRADGIISLTDQITEELCAAGFDRQRIVQIPNGIDLAHFAPVTPEQRAELRRQLGLPADQIVALFAGRLEPEKAVDVLLRAWKLVQASQPQALLVLAGSGSLRAALEALSRDLGLENSVRFIGYADQMLPLYQSADVFVLPSLAEGISNALLEAMACGLTPVATAIPGNTDVVTDGRDGLLIRPGAEADLAAALERIISDAALRTSLAEAALQTIGARFTLEQTALRYADLYQQVAAGPLKSCTEGWTGPGTRGEPAMSTAKAQPRLRILHIITGLEIGGAERVLLETARYQKAEGHEVSVCSLRPGGPLEAAAREVCQVYTANMGHALTPQVVWRLARLMRRGGYDIAHSYLYQANLATRLAARLARVPVNISSVRCSYTWLNWKHFLVDRWTAHLADCITSVSEATRQFSIEREGLPAAKIVTLPNGIDGSRFAGIDRPTTRAALRETLGYGADDLVVCTTGRLHEQKGHTYLFQAAEQLKERYPHLRLLIIGDGPQRAALEVECQERGLAGMVTFLGMRKDVPELLAAADLFAFPSLYEGMPNAVLEAMAMSLPVVASTADGTVEIIEHEKHGMLVPPGDAPALKDALERLLADPALRRQFAEAGYRRVVEEFTFQKTMQQTEALYYAYLRRKAPGRLSQPTLGTLVTGERL